MSTTTTNFSRIPVSTQTIIVRTNIVAINLALCYDDIVAFASADVRIADARYGERRMRDSPSETVSSSSTNDRKPTFLNCITLSILGDDDAGATTTDAAKRRKPTSKSCATHQKSARKLNGVSAKIFHNGVFQLTGCRSMAAARAALHVLIDAIIASSSVSMVADGDAPRRVTYYLESAMRNVDFNLGFHVDRIRLGNYAERHTPYTVPPMTSGYMGVKVRIAVHDVEHVPVLKSTYPAVGREDVVEYVSYGTLFRDVYPGNEKRIRKRRFVSMSVFQNGKVLMSGMHACVQEPCYRWFVAFTRSIRHLIEIEKPLGPRSFKRSARNVLASSAEKA